ncbi:hypothetical protein BGX34_004204, partial [Mortierella sp. NVP85]
MLPENLLPEIAGLVATYLRKRDVVRCVQVSKSWRDVFLPHRWRVIVADFRRSYGPHANCLYDHRHLIHELSYSGDLSELEGHDYPFVRKLAIRDQARAPKHSFNLTEMFPLLVDLHIRESYVAASTWSTLSAHPHIARLRLCGITIGRDFWKACTQLEMLTLIGVTINGVIPTSVFDRLHTLDIHHVMNSDGDVDGDDQLDLIRRFSNLETLNWQADRSDSDEVLDLYGTKGSWPSLRSLSISHELKDTDMASILEGIGKGHGCLINLKLSDCSFGKQASRALNPHFTTLVTIDLNFWCQYASTAIRDILCSCPRLEVLRVKSVLARDVVTDRPWICQRLRELRICFLFRGSEKDLQQKVFGHLSTLIRLEHLKMDLPDFESFEHEEEVLEFRL